MLFTVDNEEFIEGNAVYRQVLHEPQVKRELLKGEPLKQRQHVIVGLAIELGADEIVGVFNATRAALHVGELAQFQRLQQVAGLLTGDFCIHRHGLKTQKFPAAFAAGRLNLVSRHAAFGLYGDGFGFAAHAQFVNAVGAVFNPNAFGSFFNRCYVRLGAGLGRSRRR